MNPINTEHTAMQMRNFYAFVSIDNIYRCKELFLEKGHTLHIKGTLLLATEGINASLVGTPSSIIRMQEYIESTLGITIMPSVLLISDIPLGQNCPFRRYKVKCKPEVVTLKASESLDPTCIYGIRVHPTEWNAIISDPSTLLIDTRNNYEYHIGHFAGAINPNTVTFKEFPEFISQHLDTQIHTQVAMYCTGGIRCEKASSLMLHLQFKKVYQLEGGILRYFTQIPPEKSLWKGACFVFDDRVAIDMEMSPTSVSFDDIHAQMQKDVKRLPYAGHVYNKLLSRI